MQGTGLPLLSSWQNFYIITGAAAATLTGLMFVTATLLVGFERRLPDLDAGIAAFNTPTMMHFCMVLLTAGILSAPWQAFWNVSLALGLLGLGMLLYLANVTRWMRHIRDYALPLKDMLWYSVFPLAAYATLIAAAAALPAVPAVMLYIIGAVMAAILFIGIHNAWDLVLFFATERNSTQDGGGE